MHLLLSTLTQKAGDLNVEMLADVEADQVSKGVFEEVADWVELQVDRRSPYILGIGGPGGCGKTTFSNWLLRRFGNAVLMPLDDFRLPRDERSKRNLFGSHPDGNDLTRLRACLHAARKGASFERPIFNPETGRSEENQTVPPCSLLICDGEIAAHTLLRNEFDGLILVEAHWRTQLNTRLTRDLQERKCSLDKAVEIFLQSNLRDYPLHAAGAKESADFVLYRNRRNKFSRLNRKSVLTALAKSD